MIIALFGPPGAGKDTVGKILVDQYAYRRVAFADKVRELALKLHGSTLVNAGLGNYMKLRDAVEAFGWDVKRDSEDVRKLLERVGDGCREVLGPDVWINAAFGPNLFDDDDIVVTDVRKENEITWIGNWAAQFGYDFSIWHIARNGCEKRPFDEWQPNWATATIQNNGTLDELAAKVRELVNGLTNQTPGISQR